MRSIECPNCLVRQDVPESAPSFRCVECELLIGLPLCQHCRAVNPMVADRYDFTCSSCGQPNQLRPVQASGRGGGPNYAAWAGAVLLFIIMFGIWQWVSNAGKEDAETPECAVLVQAWEEAKTAHLSTLDLYEEPTSDEGTRISDPEGRDLLPLSQAQADTRDQMVAAGCSESDAAIEGPAVEYDLGPVYDTGYRVCSAFTVEEVAAEYGTAEDPVSAAEGYSQTFEEWARPAAFNGCVDGLLAQQ